MLHGINELKKKACPPHRPAALEAAHQRDWPTTPGVAWPPMEQVTTRARSIHESPMRRVPPRRRARSRLDRLVEYVIPAIDRERGLVAVRRSGMRPEATAAVQHDFARIYSRHAGVIT